jgi:hypothetical protein
LKAKAITEMWKRKELAIKIKFPFGKLILVESNAMSKTKA